MGGHQPRHGALHGAGLAALARKTQAAPLPQGDQPGKGAQLDARSLQPLRSGRRAERSHQPGGDARVAEPALECRRVRLVGLEPLRRIGLPARLPLLRTGRPPERRRHLRRPPEHLFAGAAQSGDRRHGEPAPAAGRLLLLDRHLGRPAALPPAGLPHPPPLPPR